MVLARAPFDAYILPARFFPQVWRLIAGIGLVAVVYLGLNTLALAAVGLRSGAEAVDTLLARLAVASTPATALILLASFLPMALGVGLACRLLHRRPALSLMGPARRILPDFLRGAGAVLAVYLPVLGLWGLVHDSQPNLPPGLWLALLPLSLGGIAIQTLAEELLFRGYLVQQLAARFARAAIWAGVPALAFAALHFDPGRMGDAAPLAVAVALLFAVMAIDLTRITGGLGAAWGAHFAINAVAIAGLATGPTLSGLALRATPYGADGAGGSVFLAAAELLPLMLAWLLLRRWLAR